MNESSSRHRLPSSFLSSYRFLKKTKTDTAREKEKKLKYEDFVSMSQRIVPQEFREYLDDPKWHSPNWHQFGILEHVNRVCEAAERIFQATDIDVRAAAGFHDVGKLFMVAEQIQKGMADEREGRPVKLDFFRHECSSAGIARNWGASPNRIWIIRNHDASYRPDVSAPQRFIEFCANDPVRVTHLMALCAADAAGKGWPEGQKIQRPEIAERFAIVAETVKLDASFRDVIEAALRDW